MRGMEARPRSGPGTASPIGGPPQLRRRSSDKVIAGVCGGLADRFSLSVLGLRIVFGFAAVVVAFLLLRPWFAPTYGPSGSDLAGLRALIKLASGFGVIAYLGLWIFVPSEDQGASAARRAVRRLPRFSGLRPWIAMLAFVAGASLFGAYLGLWSPDVTWAFLLIGVGVLLFRRDAERRDAEARPAERGAMTANAPSATPATFAEPGLPTSTAPPRPPRERSPLGWLALGIALLAVGGAAILQNLDALHLRVVRFPAMFVLILGLGMLVGAWFGRARWLLVPVLLVAPAMLLVSLVTVPLVGGFEGLHASVRSAEDVRPAYRAVTGNVFVDMTPLMCHLDRVTVHASTGFGTVTLYVPFDAHVDVSASSGLGTLFIGRRSPSGAGVSTSRTLEPRTGDGPTIVAALGAGLGNVEVLREGPATQRQRRECR